MRRADSHGTGGENAGHDPSVTRTEAYTDAVFAIAATLLVLDLTTTSLGEVGSDGEMWAALGGMWPNLMAFGISFVLLSGMWMIHLRQFRDIRTVDSTLLWLNNARLLFVVLIPFTTALTSEYNDYYAGRMLLPIDFFLVALFGHLSWRWAAARGGHLMTPDAYAQRSSAAAGGLAAVTCGAIAVALSPWFGSAAFFAFLLNGPLTAILLRVGRKGRRGDRSPRGGSAGAAGRLNP
ncbi:TMEM175 family protein [Microbacterium sp.]|uniref:TMEM175 family protein n=1 Tax=Microbacterium sp. TaxID=51671 RepID=UPI0025E4F604|nr:TMEM175 family protein [Microbacterium sp.]